VAECDITEQLKDFREIAREAAKAASRALDNNELLTRIDERINFIRTIDLSEIKKHLEILNNNVAKNTERSSSNKAQIRNMWIIIIAHLGLLGTILGLIIYSLGK